MYNQAKQHASTSLIMILQTASLSEPISAKKSRFREECDNALGWEVIPQEPPTTNLGK